LLIIKHSNVREYKKIMAQRTLSSTWKQFERLSVSYFSGKKSKEDIIAKLNSCSQKANAAKINIAIKTVFFGPYPEMEGYVPTFYLSPPEVDDYPEWTVKLFEDKKEMLLNPLGAFHFLRLCDGAEKTLTTQEVRRSFVLYRHNAFLTELKKLPSKLIFFILILKRIAMLREIARVEKKGGVIEIASGEEYLTTLWAFKEVESFTLRTSGTNLRQEFAISWYESDWIIGQ